MTDAADEIVAYLNRELPMIGPPLGIAADILDALLSLAPEVYPRRVVLEQESEGGPVVVRLLELPPADLMLMAERLGAMVGYRLVDVPEEAP